MIIINKIIKIINFSFFIFIIPSIAFSDGIYVSKDLKHTLEEHTTIKLTNKQVEDVERRRKVELTDDQMNLLRKVYNKIPKKLTVVSSRWDSCTCDLGLYAIWCRPGELDVPHSGIEAQRELDEYLEKNPVKEGKYEKSTSSGKVAYVGETAIMDSKGRMYIDGKMVSENEIYAVIDRISQKQVKAARVYRSIYLDIPPPISSETDQKIKELVGRLEEHSSNKGINFWALGLSHEKYIKNNK